MASGVPTAAEVAHHYGASAKGRVCIVTGANTGIGKEAARALAQQGAVVVLACRDMAKAEQARREILASCTGADVRCEELDLGSLSSVRAFADRFKRSNLPLHLLLNNAGLMSPMRYTTVDGFEAHFGINHLGPFLLTLLLLPRLRASAPSRVVNVSSDIHTMARINLADLQMVHDFDGQQAYANSKMMNILFTQELSDRLAGTRVSVCAVHPGIVDSEFMRAVPGGSETMRAFADSLNTPVFTVQQGAATLVYAALSDDPTVHTGGYFANCKPKQAHRRARNPVLQAQLWDLSAKFVGAGVLIPRAPHATSRL